MAKQSISTSGLNLTNYATTAIANLDTEQTIISQIIPAMSLASGRPFFFDVIFDVTTGLLPPALTVKIKYGNQTAIVLNGVSVTASIAATRRFRIKGSLVNIADDNQKQLLDAETRQDANLTILSLGTTGIKPFFQDFTINSTVDQTFAVTIQAAALLNAPTIVVKKSSVGMP